MAENGLTTVNRLLVEREVLLVCGPGGVGKTTTAASLAVRAAIDGRRVLVIGMHRQHGAPTSQLSQ